MKYSQKERAYEECSLTEATNVTEPIERRVDLPVEYGKIQTLLESNSHMDVVREFVGAFDHLFNFKNVEDVLRCPGAPLPDLVLQL